MITALQNTIRRSLYHILAGIDVLLGSSLPQVTILCYHGVDTSGWYHSVTPQAFEEQIAALSTKFKFVSLSEIRKHIQGKKNISEPSVCITFDDGYKSIKRVAATLKKFGITPTVFVLSNPIQANRAELENELPFLSTTEIKELLEEGWEVGCHTATHPDLKKLRIEELKKEIMDSRKLIEKTANTNCKYIAYPKGRYNEAVLSVASESQYELGLTMDDGFISTATNMLTVPRIGVNSSHSTSELLAALSPANTVLRKSIKSLLSI